MPLPMMDEAQLFHHHSLAENKDLFMKIVRNRSAGKARKKVKSANN